MKKIISLSIFIFLIASCFAADRLLFNSGKLANAAASDNVSGFAWSETIGWISFNNTSGGGATSYGVNIDSATGNFSGYAWSENIGWIWFAPAGPYPEAPAYSARLDTVSNQVTGWARALANGGGWDGWIKMAGMATDGGSYGVSRSGCDLTGFAWGSDVVGWIKFKGTAQNGSPYGTVTTFCANSNPTATGLSVSKGNYCSSPAHFFSWTYSDADGDAETRFQFQVDNNIDNNSDFSSPEINRDEQGLNNPSPFTNNQNALVSVAAASDRLVYNTTYYWQVRVYDNQGNNSGWVSGSSFKTEKHLYPSVDFSWAPTNPSANEAVQFADQSECYGLGNVIVVCPSNAWSWNIPDAAYINSTNSSSQNPQVEFLSNGTKAVTLTVTDSDGYSCPVSKNVNVGLSLPGWKEIAP